MRDSETMMMMLVVMMAMPSGVDIDVVNDYGGGDGAVGGTSTCTDSKQYDADHDVMMTMLMPHGGGGDNCENND